MKRGRAQITVFIILALIIVVTIGAVLFVKNTDEISFNFLPFNEQANLLRESVNQCMRTVYEDSLDNLGLQGGYYNEPLTQYIDTGNYDVPFYYFGELTFIPNKKLMEEELANAVAFKEMECLELITEKNIGYNFNYKLTNVSITENTVTFLTDLKLTMSKEEQSLQYDFKNFPVEIHSNLAEMNDFASYIAYSHDINNGSLCISCFTEIADDNGLMLEITTDIENVLFAYVIDNRTNYHPQVYSFALTNIPGYDPNEFLVADFAAEQSEDNEIIAEAPETS